jgi:flagellar motor switch protein FliN/FliY
MSDDKDIGTSSDDQASDNPIDSENTGSQPESKAAGSQSSDSARSDDPEIADALKNLEDAGEQAVSSAAETDQPEAGREDDDDKMLKMLQDLPEDDRPKTVDDMEFDDGTAVSSAEFQQLQQPSASSEPRNIDLLMDVDLPVSIELGRTKLSIADILSLGPGSVVELNKLAGEPADLLINYKVVARGEVVVVDENFGLRITQLMTPEERLKALADE